MKSYIRTWVFDDEAIKNKDVHIVKSNNRNMDISDGINTEQINKSMLEDYKVAVQTNCIAIKMKTLWNSGENYIYNLNKRKGNQKTYLVLMSTVMCQ